MLNFSREVNFYAPTGSMWHQDFNPKGSRYRDRYNAWIVLTDRDARYFKHVSITGREREDGSGLMRLMAEMQACAQNGPQGMTLVEDGGDLPYDPIR